MNESDTFQKAIAEIGLGGETEQVKECGEKKYEVLDNEAHYTDHGVLMQIIEVWTQTRNMDGENSAVDLL